MQIFYPNTPIKDFVTGLSVLARGTLPEKLQWAFSLYDINGDGIITKDEMTDIVTAIYDMIGDYVKPSIEPETAREHVDRVFSVSVSHIPGPTLVTQQL